MSEEAPAGDLQSRERCPKCGGPVEQASDDPAEEFCTDLACNYYRAVGVDGEVMRE
jgi:uncharacterized protein with PIN domain